MKHAVKARSAAVEAVSANVEIRRCFVESLTSLSLSLDRLMSEQTRVTAATLLSDKKRGIPPVAISFLECIETNHCRVLEDRLGSQQQNKAITQNLLQASTSNTWKSTKTLFFELTLPT